MEVLFRPQTYKEGEVTMGRPRSILKKESKDVIDWSEGKEGEWEKSYEGCVVGLTRTTFNTVQ